MKLLLSSIFTPQKTIGTTLMLCPLSCHMFGRRYELREVTVSFLRSADLHNCVFGHRLYEKLRQEKKERLDFLMSGEFWQARYTYHCWETLPRKIFISYDTIHEKGNLNFDISSSRENLLWLRRCWIDSTSHAPCSSAPTRFTRNQSSDLWWPHSSPLQMIFSRTGTSSQAQPPPCLLRKRLLTDGRPPQSNLFQCFCKMLFVFCPIYLSIILIV